MNKHRLIKRITDERARIVDIIKDIASELKQLEVAPDEYRLNVEITIGNYLYDVYKGTEVIFKQIARDIDGRFPKSAEWHKALLRQMTERHPERPPVISEETTEGLETLLKFRHVFTSIYARQLDYKNAKQVDAVFARVSKELYVFAAFLEGHDILKSFFIIELRQKPPTRSSTASQLQRKRLELHLTKMGIACNLFLYYIINGRKL